MEAKLNQLLVRTQAFHNAAVEHVASLRPIEDLRALVAFQAGGLALEHSLAVRLLISDGRLPSAFALLRPQFESLVRGIWLLHAANESWIEKFSQPLTISKQANEGPGFADMLKELESNPMYFSDYAAIIIKEPLAKALMPGVDYVHNYKSVEKLEKFLDAPDLSWNYSDGDEGDVGDPVSMYIIGAVILAALVATWILYISLMRLFVQ